MTTRKKFYESRSPREEGFLDLEYILPYIQKLSPAEFTKHQITALQQVVADILFEIERRKGLEGHLLSGIEKRIMHLHSELMNIQPSYHLNTLERKMGIEHDLEKIETEKTHTQERTSHDLIELKKTLWHYWLLLHEKQSQLYFLK